MDLLSYVGDNYILDCDLLLYILHQHRMFQDKDLYIFDYYKPHFDYILSL